MLNHRGIESQAPRLSEVLFPSQERSFASLAALPSNVQAIEAALRFSAGMNQFVAVVGPSGWGKTHLLDAASRRISLDSGSVAENIPVPEYLGPSIRAESEFLLLDDVQEVFVKPKQRLALRLALERRVRIGKSTLLAFTSPKPSRPLRALLPSPRDWTVVTMGEPVSEERVLLLNHMGVVEGLSLSPRLVKILAEQMHGNGCTLMGALKRLRLSGTNWLEAEETLRALGLLDPFFADNSSWDLKLRINRIAEQSRSQFSRTNPTDLALYILLHKAGLGELDVARAVGVTPAAAYSAAARFQKQAAACPTTATYSRQFTELVVSSLAQE